MIYFWLLALASSARKGGLRDHIAKQRANKNVKEFREDDGPDLGRNKNRKKN